MTSVSLLNTLLQSQEGIDEIVIQVSLIEGKNLDIKDVFTSDPLMVLQLSEQMYESRVKYNTLNPTWNQTFSFV